MAAVAKKGSGPAFKQRLQSSSASRLVVMLISGILAGIISGLLGAWTYSVLIGWDVAAMVFSSWVWLALGKMDATTTAQHATRENPSRAATDVLVLFGSLASLIAIGVVLVQSGSEDKLLQGVVAGLTLFSVALSWFMVHTLFALRYAKMFYSDRTRGVDFNEEDEPTYADFGYLAFTIGMTFQVSDTNLKNRAVRSTVLRHALLSYLFGAVIVASTINLISGLSSHG